MTARQKFLGLGLLIVSIPGIYSLDHGLAITFGVCVVLLLYIAVRATRRP